MNIKDTFATSMGETQSYLDLAVQPPYDGWYGPIHFKFVAAATGIISIQIIRDSVTFTVASNSITAKTDSTWSGSIFCKGGDVIRIQKVDAGAVNISVNVTHDSVGSNEWDDFVETEVEESSSSTSSESSSSSSMDYSDSSQSDSSQSESSQSDSSQSDSSQSESSSSGI